MTALLTILSIVIGIVFVLLLFSLLASTVMEIIASVLSLRGKHLLFTLQNMLGGKAKDFLGHPFFKQLSYASHSRSSRAWGYSLPNWITKSTFSSILLDVLRDDGSPAEIEAKIHKLPANSDLKKLLLYLWNESDRTVAGFRERVEHWFDEVMARATDWYKRSTKWWLFGIGLAMAAIFNADTIQIYKSLSANATLREDFVHMAENITRKNEAANPAVQPITTEKTPEQLLAQFSELRQTYVETVQSPLGLGWTEAHFQNRDWRVWLVRMLGWILTGVAVTFGGPFWFEVLKKLLALNSAATKVIAPTTAPSTAPPAENPTSGGELESFKSTKKPAAPHKKTGD